MINKLKHRPATVSLFLEHRPVASQVRGSRTSPRCFASAGL